MRWFCVAFGTLVVVSTAMTHADSPASSATVAVFDTSTALPFEVAELSNAHRVSQGAAWSAALFLGLPFLIRRRRERLG